MKPSKYKPYKGIVDDIGRICTCCNIYKLWDAFYNTNKGNLNVKKFSQCKECVDKDRKKHKVRNREVSKRSAKNIRKKLKAKDPVLLRARALRGSLLARVKSKQLKNTTPTIKELFDWLNVSPRYCYYSGKQLLELGCKKGNNRLTIDHKLPIARGGDNTINNLCFASHNMNTAKGAMTESEFVSLLELIHSWEDKGIHILRRLKQGHF